MRIVLALLLLMAAAPARAEWVKIGNSTRTASDAGRPFRYRLI